MLPSNLTWIRTAGPKMDAALRHQMFAGFRPPRWLPCWFHRLWFLLAARFLTYNVIIGLDGAADMVTATLAKHGFKSHRHLSSVNQLCTRVHPTALQDLCQCGGVTRVWLDREVHALLDVAVPSTNSEAALSRYTGQGVTIAIMDTGIFPHPDLEDRIVGFKDFVGNRTAPYDDHGHGTHVAGCAAGDGARSDGTYRGPANQASLVGVKVLNKIGSGTMSALLSGIDWVIANRGRHNIRILSLSLGASATDRCADDPLCMAASQAWQAGIVVVVAAGNEGPSPGTVATPGISPDVITVGAMDDRTSTDRSDDQLAAFSSRGPTPAGDQKPDILAPGVSITALRSPHSYLDKTQPGARVGDWYVTLSGTSMATPLISGICALLLEARPDLTPDEVKARLRQTAEDRGMEPNEQGAGYIDVDRLLEEA